MATSVLLLVLGSITSAGDAARTSVGDVRPDLPGLLPVQPRSDADQAYKPFVTPSGGTGSDGAVTADQGGFGTVTGLVLGVSPPAGEVPLAGVTVLVFELATGQIIAATVTAADGSYTLQPIAAGERGLYADVTGFEPQAALIVVGVNETTVRNVLLAPVAPCGDCPFQDVTVETGLGAYVASTGDGHGPGAVFTDLDNDGFPELYLMRAADQGGAAEAANQLYMNVAAPGGTRSYVLAPDTAGAGDTGNATGAVAADYDNDGDVDLYVINFDQPNALLQNQWTETGTLWFVDVTADTDPTPSVNDDQFGVGIAFFEGIALDNSLTAAWADPDRDGDLDLYVGNHNGFFGVVPEGPFDVPGRRDVFYRNNGDGTFSDVTMDAGVPGYIAEDGQFQTAFQRFSSTNAVVFADFNNDRWPDLLVTNKVGGPTDRDMLYMNLGNDASGTWQGFATVTYDLVPTFGHMSGAAMGVDVADADNDGDLDIYITDWTPPLPTPGTNDVWINLFAETGTLSFAWSGVMPAVFSWGTQWQDFDNDGFVDVHVATQAAFRGYLYMNGGIAGGVIESAIPGGVAQVRNGRGDPGADYDRDGWPDLFVVNLDGGPSVLYRNNFPAFQDTPNHYLAIKLVGDPSAGGTFRSTRDAIGARVIVSADLDADGTIAPHEIQRREVVAGHGNAASTSSLDLEFGLGAAVTADVEILWPSGRHDAVTAEADQFLTIVETPTGAIPTMTTWGMIAMTLLLVAAAAVTVQRQHAGQGAASAR